MDSRLRGNDGTRRAIFMVITDVALLALPSHIYGKTSSWALVLVLFLKHFRVLLRELLRQFGSGFGIILR